MYKQTQLQRQSPVSQWFIYLENLCTASSVSTEHKIPNVYKFKIMGYVLDHGSKLRIISCNQYDAR